MKTIPWRTVNEWELQSDQPYNNPFADVTVNVTFTSPSGRTYTMPGFYDGDNTWRVRFNPGEAGAWTYRATCIPHNEDLSQQGTFEVSPGEGRGFLKATPGQAWGFHYESGEPVFLLGDTAYNLFGMQHCGGNVRGFMERRVAQGFNVLRVRVPVSPFHPPECYSDWQTRRTWAWGGSEQAPQFDRFNLDYFRTVDTVVRWAEELGIGLEMIMEAWGFEFPFNSRTIFTPEWEELWLRYLIARYDAYTCVYFWTPLNEYEFYPNGDWHHKPVADRWAMRISRWIKGVAPHGHIVSMHNGPREPAFAERFKADPEAVDAIMFQHWGTEGKEDCWLAAGIETQIEKSFKGWHGSAVLAEYGYERNENLPLCFPGFRYCTAEHTRRGAWRGAFCGLTIIHGFENSWGPFMLLEEDQLGVTYLQHLRTFFAEHVPFGLMKPRQDALTTEDVPKGHQPLVLASEDSAVMVVYLPVGGEVHLSLPTPADYRVQWFDPRTGGLQEITAAAGQNFQAPEGADRDGHPWDWILLVKGPAQAEPHRVE